MKGAFIKNPEDERVAYDLAYVLMRLGFCTLIKHDPTLMAYYDLNFNVVPLRKLNG